MPIYWKIQPNLSLTNSQILAADKQSLKTIIITKNMEKVHKLFVVKLSPGVKYVCCF